MKLKLAENSLFAVLMRSPWWVSFLAALAVFGLVRLFAHEAYALFASSPFIVIALVAGWKRLRAPSGKTIAARLERLRAMPWEEVAAALEAGFRRDGYAVKRLEGSSADFELLKDGRVSLVAAKRWKAGQTGIEPLRDLHAAGTAHDCVYVCVGEMTQNANAFAAGKKIRLVKGAELARLLSDLDQTKAR